MRKNYMSEPEKKSEPHVIVCIQRVDEPCRKMLFLEEKDEYEIK